MSSNIISSFRSFEQALKVPNDEKRVNALKVYFGNGGVLSCHKGSGKWPKLTYPLPRRIDEQVQELERAKALLAKKEKEWKDKLGDAKSYHTRHQIMKFGDPLYWKHKAKAMQDKDYRKDAEKVGLPVHLVADKRWKPMVKMFLEDAEYRKNLVETVQTSVVYKKDKKVAKYADVVQAFRSDISTSKLKDLEKKITQLEGQVGALQEIKK